MPAWITPLLCVLVSMPARRWRSSTQTEYPRAASAQALARPLTPAPITATSTCSIRQAGAFLNGARDYIVRSFGYNVGRGETCIDHRHHRAGRLVSRRTPVVQRI